MTPILNLSADIVFVIFDLLIHVDRNIRCSQPRLELIKSQSALLVALRSTQICRQWRQILIGVPLLWAKVINLDLLHTNQPFRRQVLARSKGCSLFIQGHESYYHKGVVHNTLLLPFLQQYWARIRSLDIMVDGQKMGYRVYKLVCRSPAEIENFCLLSMGRRVTHRDKILFFNGAPRLQRLTDGPYRISTSATWLKQLRELQLTPNVADTTYSFKDLQVALSQMSNLEYLSLRCDRLEQPVVPGQQVWLPNLRGLEIIGRADYCWHILSTLACPPGCAPYIQTSYSFPVPDEGFPQVAALFSQLFTSHLSAHPTPNIHITISEGEVCILTDSQTNSFFWSSEYTGIRFAHGVNMFHSRLEAFRIIDLVANITSLHLEITGPVNKIFRRPSSRQQFDDFIVQGLVQLVNLTTTPFFVEHLLHINSSVLPNLKKLTIIATKKSSFSVSNARFLFKRWRCGLGSVEIVEVPPTKKSWKSKTSG